MWNRAKRILSITYGCLFNWLQQIEQLSNDLNMRLETNLSTVLFWKWHSAWLCTKFTCRCFINKTTPIHILFNFKWDKDAFSFALKVLKFDKELFETNCNTKLKQTYMFNRNTRVFTLFKLFGCPLNKSVLEIVLYV